MPQPRVLDDQVQGITVGGLPSTAGDNFTTQSYTSDAIQLQVGAFVDTDADLLAAQIPDQSEVFNKWLRFSHRTGEPQPAVPSELTRWTFDPVTGNIICTINSTSYIGFISPTGYTAYTHEVTLSSTDGDDDTIGVIIAFAVDASGRQHTLSVIRTQGGNSPTWGIVYDRLNGGSTLIDRSTSAPATQKNSTGGGGWRDGGPTRVYVKRDGDNITCKCSQFNSTTYDDATIIEFKLSSYPQLSLFSQPSSYGYSSQSQDKSSYSDISFTETIYDVRNASVYIKDGDQYIIDPSTNLFQRIGYNRRLYNPRTGKMFEILPSGSIVSIVPLGIISGGLKYSTQQFALAPGDSVNVIPPASQTWTSDQISNSVVFIKTKHETINNAWVDITAQMEVYWYGGNIVITNKTTRNLTIRYSILLP